MEKQKILYQQARLHARGAAEMVLQMISASKGTLSWPAVLQVIYLLSLRFCSLCFSFSLHPSGRLGPMVTCTLKLGISILNGGNVQVQQVWNFSFIYFLSLVHPFNHSSNGFWFLFLFQKMLDYLKEKRDAGFFKSLSGLMQSCRWLNCVHKNKNKTKNPVSLAVFTSWTLSFRHQCPGLECIWETEQGRRSGHGDRGRFMWVKIRRVVFFSFFFSESNTPLLKYLILPSSSSSSSQVKYLLLASLMLNHDLSSWNVTLSVLIVCNTLMFL